MRRLLIALGVLVAVLLPGAPAWAHNELAEATPAAGTTLKAAPQKVSLRFLQRLNPDFTTIVVSDAAQRRVSSAEPAINGATGAVTIEEELANGAYTVAYRVVSLDGHAVKGSYKFTVADPAQPAATTPAAATTSPSPATTTATATSAAAAPAPASSSGGISGPVLIGLAVLGVVLAGAAFVLRPRKRRNLRPTTTDPLPHPRERKGRI